MTVARQVRLRACPVGLPDADTWDVVDSELPALGDGEVLVRVTHLSLDPAMRGWLNDVRSYVPPVGVGEVMRAFGVGTVLESRSREHAVGDAVSGLTGVADHAVVRGSDLSPVDLDAAPAPTWLGALSMPGL
ncbi:NADP-dependent oxidoreductase, partial [Microbacterium sp. CnD16-F]|nr:NADP-dependent oxidoreductase [Microbacterium sp. CnD16-F]